MGLNSTSLQSLCAELHQARLVETTRGRSGGARLYREPEVVRIAEIIAVGEAESGWKFTECDRNEHCNCFLSGTCKLGLMFEDVQQKVMAAFAAYTLADLMTREALFEARRRAEIFLAESAARKQMRQ